MANGKGYSTVYWGKVPVNFRPKDFPTHEVEGAVARAEAAFPEVLDLVPDFSLLSLGRDPRRNAVAVLRPGHEGRPMAFRRGRRGADREEGNLFGLLRQVARHVRSPRR